MPVSDPSAGYAFVWLTSFLLFLCIAIGGACLVMYMILPESESTSWFAIAGVTLVCLPWLFWFITCMYRIFSRIFGFRMVIGIGGGGAGGVVGGNGSRAGSGGGSRGGGSHGHANSFSSRGDNGRSSNGAVAAESSTVGNKTRQVKFGGNVSDNNSSQGRREIKDGNKQISSSDNSVASRESEIPLTSSMSS